MDLYSRLFGEGSDFSGSLQMEQVTGFTEDVLYAIAQTSTLACWKSAEILNGRLSVRELIRRGDAIEQMLRRREQEQRGSNGIELNLDFTAEGAADAVSGDDLNEETRYLVRKIFREAAILYLHTVLSDPNPGMYTHRLPSCQKLSAHPSCPRN
jgi:Fungal specific transcription factor domain